MDCCYLIDLETIKCHTGTKFHAMVTEENISDTLKILHDLDIPRTLGKQCLRWLCDSLALADLTILTTEQSEQLETARAFHEQLKPWLSWLALMRILAEPRHVRVNANGTGYSEASSRASGQQFKPAATSETQSLRSTAGTYAKGYLQRAKDWLEETDPTTGLPNGDAIPCFQEEKCKRQRGDTSNPGFWVV